MVSIHANRSKWLKDAAGNSYEYIGDPRPAGAAGLLTSLQHKHTRIEDVLLCPAAL